MGEIEKIFSEKGNKVKKLQYLKDTYDITELEERMVQREDFVTVPYRCTANVKTVGVGHTQSEAVKGKITIEEGVSLLRADLNVCMKDCVKIFGEHWGELNVKRQDALIDMSFNLGYHGLKSFKRMIRAIKREDWANAWLECAYNIEGKGLVKNKYHNQVGRRCYIIALELLTGKRQKY